MGAHEELNGLPDLTSTWKVGEQTSQQGQVTAPVTRAMPGLEGSSEEDWWGREVSRGPSGEASLELRNADSRGHQADKRRQEQCPKVASKQGVEQLAESSQLRHAPRPFCCAAPGTLHP